MSELKAQRALVAVRALHAERARLASAAARQRLLHAIRRTLTSPSVLASAFTAGFLLGPRRGTAANAAHGNAPSRTPLAHRARKLLVAASWLLRQMRHIELRRHAPF
jgi:hypothetical protein